MLLSGSQVLFLFSKNTSRFKFRLSDKHTKNCAIFIMLFSNFAFQKVRTLSSGRFRQNFSGLLRNFELSKKNRENPIMKKKLTAPVKLVYGLMLAPGTLYCLAKPSTSWIRAIMAWNSLSASPRIVRLKLYQIGSNRIM